ncbi:MAG: hypothetical protein BZ135_07000 [Methanosphaera sp. rholeuAM6]|nr:MAG: hypothetical protein BZ135_07000 [Methanosphaera sp. rholeuAM6]
MKIRQRYFIKTKDGLFFAVTDNYHPDTHIISFLRYMPCEEGDRVIDGVRYKKVSSDEAYSFLNKNHPNYLFRWNIENKDSMGVPLEDIVEVLSPVDKLNEIISSHDNDEFYDKIRLLASIFHEKAGIGYDDMGVSGSTLLNLQNPSTSDIDFIIFGLDNHRKAINLYSRLKNDADSPLDKISGKYWKDVYDKRIKDDSMSFDEFIWYESRKNNRGLIGGTLFDISCSRNDSELRDSGAVFSRVVCPMKIHCKIADDRYSYDAPAVYNVSDVQVLEGPCMNIENIVSFTHTYTGIVKNNEWVIASGVCEETTDNDSSKMYNLIVGTTRESINEYVKLDTNPITGEKEY